MDRYENNFIRIFMNIDETFINLRNIVEKSMDNTYQLTHISLNNCPRVTNLISKQYLDIVLLYCGKIWKQIYSNNYDI